MGVSTTERNEELQKVADVAGGTQRFAREQKPDTDAQQVVQSLSALVKRTSAGAVDEIDHVLTELQLLRERLQRDGSRVQQELAQYAALAQSALQSTQVISESLRNGFPRPKQR